MKILVVDDHHVSRELVKELIKQYGEESISYGMPVHTLLKAPECHPIAMRDHGWYRKFDKSKKNRNNKL